MLLGFFVFSYIHMLLGFYFIIHYDDTKIEEIISINFILKIFPCIKNIQNIILILSIIIAASRVHEKVTLII